MSSGPARSDTDLTGKVAVVTGASKGIGLACARQLAEEGCHLHLASRTKADLERAKESIQARHNVSVTIHAVDLSNGDNVRSLAAACGDIDILVNNAGAIPAGDLQAIDEARWRQAWDLKVFGYVNMCRAVYPAMKARGGGVIVNIIGNAATTHDPNYICGVTGNAGLTAFTEAIGSGSLRDGIRVLGVSPGPTATDRLVGLVGKRAQETLGDVARWPELFKAIPGGRPGKPAEIAAMVAFLASPKCAYASGVVVTMDAGVSSRAGSD